MITYTVKGVENVNRVLNRYAELNTRKTFPEIVVAKTMDMGFRALEETHRASKEEIKRLPDKQWWPKYVAQRIMGSGVVVRGRKKAGRKKARHDSKLIKGAYTRAQARQVSRTIIAARLRAVGFVAVGWLDAIRDLSRTPHSKGWFKSFTRSALSKRFGQAKGIAKTSFFGFSKIKASLISFSMNPKRTTPRVMFYARQGAERAVAATTKDMQVYIARKMRQAADKAGVPVKDKLTGRVYIPSAQSVLSSAIRGFGRN